MRGFTIHRSDPTALGELGRVGLQAHRTLLLRFGLALALAGALALTFLSARSAGAGRAAVLPPGASTGVVALDMSASIAGPTYERVSTTLKGIVAANQGIGLVMFSDVAYELLPPGSPATALLDFTRFFVPSQIVNGTPIFARTPWDLFSGGTKISAGLAGAQAALARAHVKHGSILLVSDLDDSDGDLQSLYAEALKLRHLHIPVRIVPLFPAPEDVQIFSSLFGNGAFVDPKAFTHHGKSTVQPVAAGTAWALLVLGALLVLLLALNERLNARVEIGVVA